MNAEQLLEDLLTDELALTLKRMDYWDWVIARLESAPQSSRWDRCVEESI
jgi:hypothetical protein